MGGHRATLPGPAWKQGRGGRPAGRCRRDTVDAIRYLVREGIWWRAMPTDFPHWRSVAVSAHQLLHVYAAVTGGLGFLRALSRDQVAPLRQPVPQEKLRRDDMLELGELYLALFRELGRDGRTSHADLAKAVGWSESTVRRQMDQLRQSGTLLYDLELDLPAFGFRAPTWLWLSVPPSELAATGAAFGEFPEVAYAAAITGAFNLLACAVCRDEEEFYDFLTTRVGSLRAVDRVETSPIIRTLKQSSTVLAVGLGRSFVACGKPVRRGADGGRRLP